MEVIEKIICIMELEQVYEINIRIYLVYQKPIKISDKLNKSFISKNNNSYFNIKIKITL
jgi:hypothetical protein